MKQTIHLLCDIGLDDTVKLSSSVHSSARELGFLSFLNIKHKSIKFNNNTKKLSVYHSVTYRMCLL